MWQDPAIRQPIAVSLGAIAGALSRYYLGLWFLHRFGQGFPYGTLFINTTGSLVMGFFATWALHRVPGIPAEIRLLVAVGFLGSYTTFSTYSLDTVTLLNDRHWGAAIVYGVGSVVLGLAGLKLGAIAADLLQ